MLQVLIYRMCFCLYKFFKNCGSERKKTILFDGVKSTWRFSDYETTRLKMNITDRQFNCDNSLNHIELYRRKLSKKKINLWWIMAAGSNCALRKTFCTVCKPKNNLIRLNVVCNLNGLAVCILLCLFCLFLSLFIDQKFTTKKNY